jgi:hypothetical protein
MPVTLGQGVAITGAIQKYGETSSSDHNYLYFYDIGL